MSMVLEIRDIFFEKKNVLTNLCHSSKGELLFVIKNLSKNENFLILLDQSQFYVKPLIGWGFSVIFQKIVGKKFA